MKKSDQSENQITLPQLLLTIVLAVVVLNGIILAPYMALPFSLPIRIAIAVAVIIVVKITNITFLDLLRIYIFPIGLYVYGCFQLYRSPISLVTVEFTVGLLSFVIFLWLDRKYKRVIKLVDEDAEATEDEEEEDEDAADAEVVYEADAEEDWDEDDEEEPEADNVRALESGDEGEAWEEEQAYRFRTEEAKAFFLEWARWISTEPKQTGTGGNAGGDPDYGTYHGFQSEASEKFFVEWARRVADDVEHKHNVEDDEDDWSLFEGGEKSAPAKNGTAGNAQNPSKKKKKSNKKKKRH